MNDPLEQFKNTDSHTATFSNKLDLNGESAKEFEELRKVVIEQLAKQNIDGVVHQMLYDFEDGMLLFRIRTK